MLQIALDVIARTQLDVTIGHPVNHSQIVIHDDALIAAIHNYGLEERFIRNEAIAIKLLESFDAGIVADELAKTTGNRFPLGANEWCIANQKRPRYASCSQFAIFLDEQMTDPVHCVRSFNSLVQGANELLTGIGRKKLADIILALERKILSRQIDIMRPIGIHLKKARHAS